MISELDEFYFMKQFLSETTEKTFELDLLWDAVVLPNDFVKKWGSSLPG